MDLGCDFSDTPVSYYNLASSYMKIEKEGTGHRRYQRLLWWCTVFTATALATRCQLHVFCGQV